MADDDLATATASANMVASSINDNATTTSDDNNDNAPSTLQTRFRFYEPQELVSENNNEKEDPPKNTSRFNFYDETTRQELAAVENLTKKATTLDSTDDILRSLQETEIQRLQILKPPDHPTPIPTVTTTTTTPKLALNHGASGYNNSGENGSNPYEDAIKEALDLLRKHRSPPGTPGVAIAATPPPMVKVQTPASAASLEDGITRSRTPRDQDRLLQHRMDEDNDDDEGDVVVLDSAAAAATSNGRANPTSPSAVVEDLMDAYEEHKLKARQRQERMAQYASRLQEFKSSLPTEAMEQHWPPNIANTHSNVESYVASPPDHANIPLLASQSGDSIGFSDLSHSTKEQVEAEVQRGVERVLLAILERANASRSRSTQGSLVAEDGANSTVDAAGSAVADALIRAMGELGLKSASSNGSNHQHSINLKTKTSGETEGTGVASKRSATSVVDELLAEDEDDDIFEEEASQLAIATMSPVVSTHLNLGQSWGPREEKKLPDSQEKVRRIRTTFDAVGASHSEIDRLMEECLQSEDNVSKSNYDDESEDASSSHKDSGRMNGVLGPLSKKAGGTTGVVLDIGGGDPSKAKGSGSDHSGSSSKYKGPFSGVMKYVSSAIIPTEQDDDEDSFDGRYKEREDKYSTVEDELEVDDDKFDGKPVADDDDDDGSDDIEAAELMRTLCAHFLPFGVDQKVNELIESIPDWDESNPNEAGYRIIRLSRLQLQRVELAFEKMINGLKLNSERQLTRESGDAQFAQELEEVERLLDESESSRLKGAETTKAQKSKPGGKSLSIITSGGSESEPVSKHEMSSNVDDEDDCHPHFPGVKTTGKGEMGDLEYFHLPIIFKSHVTGFEPTKDLVLEPGNVVAGQYLVESELGSAAFSTAYRCIDLSTEGEDGHEEVCLKVIKNTKDFFDQSLDEIKILELLRQTGKVHENHIVEMKCFFYYREHLVIVTELLRQNLFEFGKFILDNNEEPYFTIPRLAYISRQALISLRFVHSLGLVHSDVKPENMLLSSYSRAQIKLIDFGSSCYLTDRQSSYIQSRSYRAPEVVLGLPYTGKIDVWSLGCVIAEMFTGEVTFQNDSIVSMLSRIEAICGPFPRHMIAQGRQSGRFFTKSGLLFEVVDDSERGEGQKTAPGPHGDEDDDEFSSAAQFDIFQPKNTRLCSRLGFEADLMDGFDVDSSKSKRVNTERRHQQLFCDFVRRLLTVDPDGRPTADEALEHPWMQYAATLTEEDVKYPSS